MQEFGKRLKENLQKCNDIFLFFSFLIYTTYFICIINYFLLRWTIISHLIWTGHQSLPGDDTGDLVRLPFQNKTKRCIDIYLITFVWLVCTPVTGGTIHRD